MTERMITVRLFAAAAQAAGAEEIRMEFPGGTPTVGDVVDTLPGLVHARTGSGAAAETSPDEPPCGGWSDLSGGDRPTREAPTTATSALPLEQVCSRSSFLLNERRAQRDTPVAPGDVLDVLPPFAGG